MSSLLSCRSSQPASWLPMMRRHLQLLLLQWHTYVGQQAARSCLPPVHEVVHAVVGDIAEQHAAEHRISCRLHGKLQCKIRAGRAWVGCAMPWQQAPWVSNLNPPLHRQLPVTHTKRLSTPHHAPATAAVSAPAAGSSAARRR